MSPRAASIDELLDTRLTELVLIGFGFSTTVEKRYSKKLDIHFAVPVCRYRQVEYYCTKEGTAILEYSRSGRGHRYQGVGPT